eukprot:CAMPEP_0119362358 /NCGR_PEP_ID=MMETSP1334-20130426/9441_1 /TAXON_ID=127549 /ORGANISM="Calcidiscus leptoporus, Strain RCC1130" /LENGTH=233 /DNA_ID=CAMNT_0007377557 /DNA_START=569 /DNA_END=1270 /DNA_ORIENTATION=-
MHRAPRIPTATKHAALWIFATSNGTGAAAAIGLEGHIDSPHESLALARRFRWPVQFTQSTVVLSRLGYRPFAARYSSIFKLRPREHDLLVEYIRYWDVLRLCCGLQMSADWREELFRKYDVATFQEPPPPPRHPRESPAYPACETYDLSAVEVALMRTEVYRRFGADEKRIRALTEADGDFNGTYCRTVNERIGRHRLGFNEKWPRGAIPPKQHTAQPWHEIPWEEVMKSRSG